MTYEIRIGLEEGDVWSRALDLLNRSLPKRLDDSEELVKWAIIVALASYQGNHRLLGMTEPQIRAYDALLHRIIAAEHCSEAEAVLRALAAYQPDPVSTQLEIELRKDPVFGEETDRS